jgi:hypothetical protein
VKSLKQLCAPRNTVFDHQRRDTVLDLTDLSEDRINPDEFFSENYITEGMKTLLEQAFRRLEGKSEQGVFKIAQGQTMQIELRSSPTCLVCRLNRGSTRLSKRSLNPRTRGRRTVIVPLVILKRRGFP